MGEGREKERRFELTLSFRERGRRERREEEHVHRRSLDVLWAEITLDKKKDKKRSEAKGRA